MKNAVESLTNALETPLPMFATSSLPSSVLSPVFAPMDEVKDCICAQERARVVEGEVGVWGSTGRMPEPEKTGVTLGGHGKRAEGGRRGEGGGTEDGGEGHSKMTFVSTRGAQNEEDFFPFLGCCAAATST